MAFLNAHRSGQQQAARLIREGMNPGANQPALFGSEQLAEFATGSLTRVFGLRYAVFDGRRHPRIPNGDLLMMSRVISIHAKPAEFNQPASISVEFDPQPGAWYNHDPQCPSGLPLSALMEIALQPCGFLSAYLGTSLLFPDTDFYFRNLDGNLELLSPVPSGQGTLTTRAQLHSTLTSNNTIIQRYSFETFCQNSMILRGDTVFGYFPPETMAAQAGLDGPNRAQLNLPQPAAGSHELALGALPLPTGQLRLIDQIWSSPGQVFARRQISPQDWFFACHFYQDPVMPGSLGVEAMLQALQAHALSQTGARSIVFPSRGLNLSWKYRGQVLPSHHQISLALDVQREHNRFSADASLWADAVRIYEVRGLVLSVE
jgi:3-hydroxymyristoyl/3-hydroxydecanoyl-(acyl carrier protein) dehydratase